MAGKWAQPSRFTWCAMAIYSVGSMVPFALSDKSLWVFAAAMAGAIPLGMWLARRDQRMARYRRWRQ